MLLFGLVYGKGESNEEFKFLFNLGWDLTPMQMVGEYREDILFKLPPADLQQHCRSDPKDPLQNTEP